MKSVDQEAGARADLTCISTVVGRSESEESSWVVQRPNCLQYRMIVAIIKANQMSIHRIPCESIMHRPRSSRPHPRKSAPQKADRQTAPMVFSSSRPAKTGLAGLLQDDDLNTLAINICRIQRFAGPVTILQVRFVEGFLSDIFAFFGLKALASYHA